MVMQPDYLLDTTAIISINSETLSGASRTKRLSVSPLAVFELLCHIDENDNFDRQKANLLKCRYLTMRDDPFAEHAAALGAASTINPTRFEDRVVLPLIFPILEASASLDDFYRRVVNHPIGRDAPIRGIAERTRHALKQAECDYVRHVIKIHSLLRESASRDQIIHMEARPFMEFVIWTARSLAREYRNAGNEISDSDAFLALCFNVGYVISRLKYYASNVGPEQSLHIDSNDMEDSSMLLHLNLVESTVLVTNDGSKKRRGTIQALKETIAHLQRVAVELGVQINLAPRVVTVDEFKAIS